MTLRGCCGWNLRSSSLAIGIFFLANTILHLIILAILWVRYQNIYRLQDIPTETREALSSFERIVFIPVLIYALLCLLFNVLLIHGVRRSSFCAVFAWLIYYAIVFVIFVLISIGLLIACGVLHAGYSTLQEQLKDSMSSSTSTFSGRVPEKEALTAAYAVAVGCGVAGAFGLLVSPLLWYWYALVRAFSTELSGFTVGDAGKGQGQEGQVDVIRMS